MKTIKGHGHIDSDDYSDDHGGGDTHDGQHEVQALDVALKRSDETTSSSADAFVNRSLHCGRHTNYGKEKQEHQNRNCFDCCHENRTNGSKQQERKSKKHAASFLYGRENGCRHPRHPRHPRAGRCGNGKAICIDNDGNDDDDNNNDLLEQQNYDVDSYYLSTNCSRIAKRETIAVHVLRVAVLLLLVCTATIIVLGVFYYMKQDETKAYHREYYDNVDRIGSAFHDAIERRLGAIHTMSTSITAYATDTNQTFPFITIPNFAIRGSALRVNADAVVVHWAPLVTDNNRLEWERYALHNRFHVDKDYEADTMMQIKQDREFGYYDARDNYSIVVMGSNNNTTTKDRQRREQQQEDNTDGFTILDDVSGYHARIWSGGAVLRKGDEPEGSGPFLPLWQRSSKTIVELRM